MHDAMIHDHHEQCTCNANSAVQQSLAEVSFTQSACYHAMHGNLDKLQQIIHRRPTCVHSDGAEGAVDTLTHIHTCAAQAPAATRHCTMPHAQDSSTLRASCCPRVRAVDDNTPGTSWHRSQPKRMHSLWQGHSTAPRGVCWAPQRRCTPVRAQCNTHTLPFTPLCSMQHGADVTLRDGDGATAADKALAQARGLLAMFGFFMLQPQGHFDVAAMLHSFKLPP